MVFQESIKKEPILKILKDYEFCVEEPYFSKSLEKYKLSSIVSLLLIVEEKLIPKLVEEIDEKLKGQIDQKVGEEILMQFYRNYKELNCQKSIIDFKNSVGRYIIRSKQNIKAFPNMDAFEQMQYFDSPKEKLFGNLQIEDEIRFANMELENKFIYGFYKFLMKQIHKNFIE